MERKTAGIMVARERWRIGGTIHCESLLTSICDARPGTGCGVKKDGAAWYGAALVVMLMETAAVLTRTIGFG